MHADTAVVAARHTVALGASVTLSVLLWAPAEQLVEVDAVSPPECAWGHDSTFVRVPQTLLETPLGQTAPVVRNSQESAGPRLFALHAFQSTSDQGGSAVLAIRSCVTPRALTRVMSRPITPMTQRPNDPRDRQCHADRAHLDTTHATAKSRPRSDRYSEDDLAATAGRLSSIGPAGRRLAVWRKRLGPRAKEVGPDHEGSNRHPSRHVEGVARCGCTGLRVRQ